MYTRQIITSISTLRQLTSIKDLPITDLTLLYSPLIGLVPLTLYTRGTELIVTGDQNMSKENWSRLVTKLTSLSRTMQSLNLGGFAVADLICTAYLHIVRNLENTSEQEIENGN